MKKDVKLGLMPKEEGWSRLVEAMNQAFVATEAVEALLQPLTRLLEERSAPRPASPSTTVAEAPESAQGWRKLNNIP